MLRARAIAPIALLFVSLAPVTAGAKVIIEPTPVEATDGKAAVNQSPWIATTSGALEGDHLVIKGNSSDSFGNSWWGGGYHASYEIWDWKNGANDLIVGGASLRTVAKLLFAEHEVASIHAGVHNWTGNTTNGSITVMGKKVTGWFLSDQALKETYEKSTNFFDKGRSFGLGPFSVEFKATASGSVRIEQHLELKDMRATLNVVPSTRVNVTGSAGIDLWLASAKVVGSLEPLVGASMPVQSWVQLRTNKKPCFKVNARIEILTMNGKLELVLDYLIDTYRKTIASWSGLSKEFEMVNVEEKCKLIVIGPIGPKPPLGPIKGVKFN